MWPALRVRCNMRVRAEPNAVVVVNALASALARSPKQSPRYCCANNSAARSRVRANPTRTIWFRNGALWCQPASQREPSERVRWGFLCELRLARARKWIQTQHARGHDALGVMVWRVCVCVYNLERARVSGRARMHARRR